MKKALLLVLCLTLFLSCKTENKSTTETTKTEEQKDTQVLKGDFVYFQDAAVLQTADQIYGVVINQKMHELDKQTSKLKKESTDMIPVEIKGIVTPKQKDVEGWPLQIEITDIISVSAPKTQNKNTIKI